MKSIGYVHWQDADMWLGYLEEFPDYMTQGESLAALEENLRDIYDDLTGGKIPCVRRQTRLVSNPRTKQCQPIPRHCEIKEFLARNVIKKLSD